MNYTEFKSEIVTRCKSESACKPEFERILKAETFEDIFEVLKYNWNWSCNHKIIEPEIIQAVQDEARISNIFLNENVIKGYLFASGNSTVSAYGNSTVSASGNSTVSAFGNSTVSASDNSTVRAYDNSTVSASGNSTVSASGNSTVRAYDNSTVRAYDNSFISSYKNIDCKLSDNSIFRNYTTNEITITKGSYKINEI